MQVLLEALPEQGCRTTAELAAVTGLDPKYVSQRAAVLHARALIVTDRPGCYRITAAGLVARAAGTVSRPGPKGPLTGRKPAGAVSLTQHVWTALRFAKKATVRELVGLAGLDDGRYRDPVGQAGRYLALLTISGHVAALPRREPGTAPTSNGHIRFLLVRDSGPRAPLWSQRHGDITDPNTGERFPQARSAP